MTNASNARKSALPAVSSGFTAPQKAALVIAALGPEAAGPIMERIEEKHLKAFADAYAHLQRVPRSEVLAIASEFVSQLQGTQDGGVNGGLKETRQLLAHFKGDDGAEKLVEDIDAPGGKTVWEKLEAIDEKSLAGYLEKQNPQVIAVVLSRLDTDKASNMMALLPPDLSQELVVRMAKPMPVRREALRVLGDTIDKEFLAPAKKAAKAKKPGEAIGAMLNNMSEEQRDNLLKFIEEKTPEILEDVKSQILTFKDIPTRVPANAIPQVIRELDVQTFLKAAKYGRQNAPDAIEFMFANISQRMVQQYEEQMQELKPFTVPDAERAQAEVMAAVRRLAAAGEFELVQPASEEEEDEETYV